MKKRLLAYLLSLCMVLSLIPATAMAGSIASFTDVSTTDWYYQVVTWAAEEGIMDGTTETTFAPETNATRSEIVYGLHQLAGAPNAEKVAPFLDVTSNMGCADAVAWAAENKVVSGYDVQTFGPNDPVTREQMSAILYRFAKHLSVDTSAETSLQVFSDYTKVDAYAVDAMEWACAEGLFSGMGDGTLNPDGFITRAQVASILYRYDTKLDGEASDDATKEETEDKEDAEEFTVTFDLNYGDEDAEKVTVDEGDTVDKPDNPSRSRYKFLGWYTKASGGEKFDFDTKITEDITLYAHWQKKSSGGSGSSSNPSPSHTHAYGDWESNGDGTHSKKCANSGCDAETVTESCDYTNSMTECGVCGYKDGNYHIATVAQLQEIARMVNEGESTFEDETVLLEKDINLNGVAWTPIGTNADDSKKFKGTFDGQDNTISNLTVDTTEKPAYQATGFFGALNGTVQNLIFKNAKINGLSVPNDKGTTNNGIAVVAGSIYSQGTIDKVDVIGATVVGNRYVGGIAGYVYGDITNCTVSNSTLTAVPEELNGIYDNGDKVGGIIGYQGESNYVAEGNTVKNVKLSGYRDIGGVVGAAHSNVTGNTVDGVEITYQTVDGKYADDKKNGNIGEIVGRTFRDTVEEDNTAKNVIMPWVGEKPIPEGNVLKISTLEQLKAFRDAVNGSNTYTGVTVKLTADIDLGSEEWTPIGNFANKFMGTFDGQNHTISNLLITGKNSHVGLFGYTTNGEVKNLTVDNATVTGDQNVGAIAGTPYTSKYTNITLTGLVEINGFAYVGGMFGKEVYADTTNLTIDANAGSYVSANSVDETDAYRTYVGGVAGYMGEGSHTMKNVTSNIDVIGSTCDVGGIVGIAHYDNKFINCSSSGNVRITNAAAAADAQEIGGIAGVWFNETGHTVTLTDCKYTGKLSTNIDSVEYCYSGLVGKAYYETGEGLLIIDGVTYVAGEKDYAVDDEGNWSIYTLDGLKEFAAKVNSGDNDFKDKTVTLVNNIDLKDEAWTPIGTDTCPFKGTFDGNKNTISNLKVAVEGEYAGLFGHANSATLKNINVDNADVMGVARVGVIAGCAYTGTVENCHVTGNIRVEGNYKVGGITGGDYAKVINCFVKGDNGSYLKGVHKEKDLEGDNVGGIIGFTGEANTLTIKVSGCSVENIDVSGTRKVGGVVGCINENIAVDNCSFKGTVTCTADDVYTADNKGILYVGGIVGEARGTTANAITNCTVKSGTVVTGLEKESTGAVFGGARNGIDITQTDNIVEDGVEVCVMLADGLMATGSAEYSVSNANGLKALNQMMEDEKLGKNVVVNITDDIDFTGKTWTPVDSHADKTFTLAEINGNENTIYNLTIEGQAMFTRFAGSGDVTIKDITFDNAKVNSNGQINTSILTVQSYQNVLLDNVDVKNSTITGGYKVAPLIATVYNESPSTVTATLVDCDVENCTVKATSYDFCTAGMVAFVHADNNDRIEFEDCTVTDVKLIAPDDGNKAHATIYTTGSGSLFNEAEGVTVTDVTFEAL